MKKTRGVLFIAVLFLIIVSLSLSSASTKLLCVDKGQTIKFSKCNSIISYRTCTTKSGCQYCVNEVSKGVYCPISINACNSGGFSCSSLETTDTIITPIQDTNNNNQNTNPQTNTNTNNNQNTNSNTNTNTNTQTNTQTTTTTNQDTNTLTIKPGISTGVITSKDSTTNSDSQTNSNPNLNNQQDSDNSADSLTTTKNVIFSLDNAEFSLESPISKMLVLSSVFELIIAIYVLMIYRKIK